MVLKWFQRAVVYQIYPKSYKDTSGNGFGDLNGITEKLEYLKKLNIDVVWLSPIFKSPNKDNGYDVSDYYSIMPELGTMDDFDKLLKKAHQLGLKIVLDLVPNHTSDEHAWFLESKTHTDNLYRDYYIWKKPANDGGPPNNWKAFFGGSAWTLDEKTGEYYLHLFTKNQPDLNWENPKVREQMHNIMKFWLDKGVDGYRIDVATLLSKDQNFNNIELTLGFRKIIENYYANGPKIHHYLSELNDEVMKHYNAFTMGEGVGVNDDLAHLYVAESRKELDMIYHFDVLEHNIVDGKFINPTKFDLINLKSIFRKWQKVFDQGGWIANALGNHDFARCVTRFGNDTKYHKESAKMLITMLATQNGTLNIYQGDEIGMTNVLFDDIKEVDDVYSINFYEENKISKKFSNEKALQMINNEGRDNARTPMQWSADNHGGFTTSNPWLKVNPNYTQINVAEQENDEFSILNYYKNLLALKKQYNVFSYGKLEEFEVNNPDFYGYIKSDNENKIAVFLSFSHCEIEINRKFNKKNFEILINNYNFVNIQSSKIILKPYQSLILTL